MTHPEVAQRPGNAAVEAEQTSGFVALRENHDRAIGETEAEIGIADVEIGDRTVIVGFQACNVIALGSQIAEKGAPGRFAKTDAEQVVDLGRDRCRQDQPTLLLGADSQQRLEPRLLGRRSTPQAVPRRGRASLAEAAHQLVLDLRDRTRIMIDALKVAGKSEVSIPLGRGPVAGDRLADNLRLGSARRTGQTGEAIRLLVIEVNAGLAHEKEIMGTT
jgi:hypothetical protein